MCLRLREIANIGTEEELFIKLEKPLDFAFDFFSFFFLLEKTLMVRNHRHKQFCSTWDCASHPYANKD